MLGGIFECHNASKKLNGIYRKGTRNAGSPEVCGTVPYIKELSSTLFQIFNGYSGTQGGENSAYN